MIFIATSDQPDCFQGLLYYAALEDPAPEATKGKATQLEFLSPVPKLAEASEEVQKTARELRRRQLQDWVAGMNAKRLRPYHYTDSKGARNPYYLRDRGFPHLTIIIDAADQPRIQALVGSIPLLIPELWGGFNQTPLSVGDAFEWPNATDGAGKFVESAKPRLRLSEEIITWGIDHASDWEPCSRGFQIPYCCIAPLSELRRHEP